MRFYSLHTLSAIFLTMLVGIGAAETNPVINVELYSDNKCQHRVGVKSSNVTVECARIDDSLGVHGIIPSGPQNFQGGFNTLVIFTKPECPDSQDPYVAQSVIFNKCNYLRDEDVDKYHYTSWQLRVHND